MAVLVSMVFIGIVASAMIKNTSSQASATVAYAGMTEMASTVGSGMIATEAYFKNATQTSGHSNLLLEKLTNASDQPYIFNDTKDKIALGSSRQFFSSRIMNFKMINDNNITISFEVAVGRNAVGRDLKKATAYYTMENITESEEKPVKSYGGKHAVYMEGRLTGNHGLDVDGSVMFKKPVRFQNKSLTIGGEAYFADSLSFSGGSGYSATFDSSVYVNGPAVIDMATTFKGDAYFENGAANQRVILQAKTTFEKNAYFGRNLSITSNIPEFKGDVGFNNGVGGNNFNISIAGNTFLNEGFFNIGMTGQKEAANLKLIGGSSKTFYHKDVSNNDLNNVSGYNAKTAYTGEMLGTAPNKLNVKKVEAQEETKLNPARINELKNMDGAVFASSVTDNAGNFNMSACTTAYNNAKNNGKLYNDHLVVYVNGSGTNGINFSGGTAANFDKKVMFIVDDGGHFGGNNFYNSTEDASTLVYIGAGAKMGPDQFGGKDINFRGLFYVHEDAVENNNRSGAFQMQGDNNTFTGAFHNFSQREFIWNTGSGPAMPMSYDEELLSNFSALKSTCHLPFVDVPDDYECEDEYGGSNDENNEDSKYELIDNTKGIILKPMGYYFH